MATDPRPDRRSVLTRRMLRSLTMAVRCAEELRVLLPIADDMALPPEPLPEKLQVLARYPIVNLSTLTVTWRGRMRPIMSQISLGILERLARRPNHAVSFDRLREVWRGGFPEDDTIRSSVRHLRSRLKAVGMADLANAIRGYGRRYTLQL